MASVVEVKHRQCPSQAWRTRSLHVTDRKVVAAAAPAAPAAAETDASLPPGAWDSHTHVLDEDRFPLHPLHHYRPKKATLSDLRAVHASLGIDHVCLVAFSVYHTDNRSLLDALDRLNGRGRAVACIDPHAVTDEELQRLHDAGVRAVRLNLRTRGDKLDVTALKATAERVRPYSWALQVHIALWQVAELAPIVPDLDVPVIIDHIGSPEPDRGPGRSQTGYREFIQLLQSGRVWTKLSGAYRFAELPDLSEYATEIMRTAPDRVVWASDWPHSGGAEHNPGGDRTKVQEYRKIDDRAWILQCKAWCNEVAGSRGEELAKKIWVDNPRALWQYDAAD